MARILLTGSTGFVGTALLAAFKNVTGVQVVPAVRRVSASTPEGSIAVGNMDGTTDYSAAIQGIDIVVHAAARAHIMRDEVADPLAEYRKVNVEGTLKLAQDAAAAGVKRFIYISSIKVNGESTTGRDPFSATHPPAPQDPYGLSKQEAEDGLRQLAVDTGMEVVIIRPPLVYGPGVKANFLSLLKVSDTGLPLPFARIKNVRSLVYVGNLVDCIIRCTQHPAAANQTFLVSDGEDVSLPELVKHIRTALGRPARLMPVPVGLFKLAGALTGKQSVVDRLVGDLQVDTTNTRVFLDWTPPFTLEQGLQATVAEYKQSILTK
ncbi:UDP-glucose 4-epimerase family protein [Nitrincola alkalisediminis]|uniref:UDP-glucose 4-epimerase family protein n=1 Tax=Nitrincola alkalisediminis TaxID=1366656 RepID=UPI0018746D53|nr:SDR family oxidoreductase [Nitrincola alkalisediminis]